MAFNYSTWKKSWSPSGRDVWNRSWGPTKVAPVPVPSEPVKSVSLLTPLGAAWSKEESERWVNRLRRKLEEEKKLEVKAEKLEEEEQEATAMALILML